MAAIALLIAFFPRHDGAAEGQGVTESALAPAWRETPEAMALPFSVMQGGTAAPTTHAAAFLAAFRFAGTFFLYGLDEENPALRRGVLSYLPESRQEIVSEGSVIEGVQVKKIYEDRIVLEKDGEEGTLTLGGGSGSLARPFLADAQGTDMLKPVKTRFGEQTGDGVWTLEKKAVMDYYEELLEEPERLLKVFDSMRPLYAKDGEGIEGYVLQSVGENDFFADVGFREGDIVRRVNALPMTNRGRAEFFIRQVVQDKLSAVVIDIEREGGAKRMVYQLR